jgi:D-sedoheptulose 7-phosphate isomerase
MDNLKQIREILESSAKLKTALAKQAPVIAEIANQMVSALKKGGKIIIFGNGGSAADSQHMAAELVGRFNREKRPLAAMALTTNTSILTAIGNDYGYEYSFAKQIEAHCAKGDIIFAISTSGNAKNVIEAVLTAKKMKVKAIGLSGKDGGRLSKISDLSIIVPSNSTARIQEVHITIIHIICELIEEAFI